MITYKQPVSVLVVIHTVDQQVLLLDRAKHPGFWQSVTGSREGDESLRHTASRELQEETGLIVSPEAVNDWQLANRFEILPLWRERYAPGVTHNTEHVFSVCLETAAPITIHPEEHRAWKWLPLKMAAAECFSWTNRDAILMLEHQSQNKLL
jgi:dATP pyrophosphohydrolase